jgi:D-lactate dehydrogenase (cytochrome)
MTEAERLNEWLVQRCAVIGRHMHIGEQGVGYGKIDFLIAENGEAVSVMRATKKAIDDNIMNPYKILRLCFSSAAEK